ncbi:MAG TPA: carbohydrate ABC transporter permease [Armatimonadetes bacterium]|nr:carbohydrate ABC transporter permease [Armatimonadota bacterium]
MSSLSRTGSRRLAHGLSYLFLIVVGISMVVPLLWMLSTSLKSPTADVLDPAQWLPNRLHWENYHKVWVEIDFARALINSAFVTIAVTTGQVFTSSLAAFAFARLHFFGRDKIFLGYLATLMVPSTVTMIPVFILLRELRWINTYYALIIPAMFSAYGTFLLRQFFLSIPRDLEDAAVIDGCSSFGIYRNVILPLSKPALSALAILTFIGSWRSFMWPLIVTHEKEMFTLPVALASFQEMFTVQWTLLMAGSVIMILPMLLVFMVGQRFFIEGIRVGAVKG